MRTLVIILDDTYLDRVPVELYVDRRSDDLPIINPTRPARTPVHSILEIIEAHRSEIERNMQFVTFKIPRTPHLELPLTGPTPEAIRGARLRAERTLQSMVRTSRGSSAPAQRFGTYFRA